MSTIKERLAQDAFLIGGFASDVHNANIAPLFARAGYDFILLDQEHGNISHEGVAAVTAAARGVDLPVLVRIPEIRREAVMKPLDNGAQGLVVPFVKTADEVRRVIEFGKFPPVGSRGCHPRRPANLYARQNIAEFMAEANENTLILVQVETKEAMDNLDEILAVPGLDGIFVGPFDLSVALGIPGQLDHPKEVEAIETAVSKARAKGLAAAMFTWDEDSLRTAQKRGFNLATYMTDTGILADAAHAVISQVKETAPEAKKPSY